ncbi:MAG: hypothetical protein AB8B51_07075 [Sedimentitalea sp.]
MKLLTICTAVLGVGLGQSAVAQDCTSRLSVKFIESAPRDYFVIRHEGDGSTLISGISLDLAASSGSLIFDSADGGAGVEVNQPFRSETTTPMLTQEPSVLDGSTALRLAFSGFKPGEEYRFSIDVDDRATNSDLGQIRVTGGEMKGAEVEVAFATPSGETQIAMAEFDANNAAQTTLVCS